MILLFKILTHFLVETLGICEKRASYMPEITLQKLGISKNRLPELGAQKLLAR